MDQHSYTDRIKEASREQLWTRAISALTSDRDSSRLLRRERLLSGWDYCTSQLNRYTDLRIENAKMIDWLSFADSRYGSRSASDLRVAYFCGPEPENDMRVLASHGVRIENVWAIEQDSKAHAAALERARVMFPALKIYHGGFDSFVRVVRDRFDIIYLDFTAPFFSPEARPYATIHSIFDEQVLSDFGALVVNVAEPLNDEDTFQFLAAYFAQQPYVESEALGYRDDENPEEIWYAEVSPDQWASPAHLVEAIRSRLFGFYSAFCTQYPSLYANRVQPALRLLRVTDARRSLYAKDTKTYETAARSATNVDALIAMLSDKTMPAPPNGFGPGMDFLMSPKEFPLWWFIETIRERPENSRAARKWLAEYESKLIPLDSGPYKPSRTDGIRLSDLLWDIAEGYFPIASEKLLQAIIGALRVFVGRKEGLFCDIPMLHLLSQLALNQLGFPYHPVQDQHCRATYKAKKTQMFLDIHLFDQCRPLYDRLPSISLYPDHFRDIEQQMITRIAMSLIGGQARGMVPNLYEGSSLVGRYDEEWERCAPLPHRADLNT